MKSYSAKVASPKVLLLSMVIFVAGPMVIKAQTLVAENQLEFNYLTFENEELLSTHAIKYSLKIPAGFGKIRSLNHQPAFNNHPFNVSVAGIKKENAVVMVHAEKVTDDSGFLDYSYLQPAKLSGQNFFMKERCLELNDEIFKEAADLRHFKENGVDFGQAIYLRQFFTNTPDGTYEYVLSYIESVCDCSDTTITPDFMDEFSKALEETIKLTEISE